MDEDLRHESYKEHDIKSMPVSVDLPGVTTPGKCALRSLPHKG